MITNKINRKALSYFSLVALVVFNGILAGFLMYIGKQVVENTRNSHILEIPRDTLNETSGKKF